jgi:hypothetical protein
MSRSDSIVATFQAGEFGSQGVGRLGRAGFDGADRDAEAFGDLGVGEAVSDQAHHVAVDRGQLVKGLVYGHDRERLVDRVVLGRQLEVLDGEQGPRRRTPGDVVGRRAGHREKPPSHRAPVDPVVGCLLAELDEGLLHHFLGQPLVV